MPDVSLKYIAKAIEVDKEIKEIKYPRSDGWQRLLIWEVLPLNVFTLYDRSHAHALCMNVMQSLRYQVIFSKKNHARNGYCLRFTMDITIASAEPRISGAGA